MFGHPRKTWACDDTDCFWPSELLPPILEDESARILSYGYDSGAETFTDREPRHKIHDVIKSFGRDLASNRQVWHIYPDIPTLVVEVFSNASKIRKATQRPLIFVAHSMGGLIVKGVCTLVIYSLFGYHLKMSGSCQQPENSYGVFGSTRSSFYSSINLWCHIPRHATQHIGFPYSSTVRS